MSVKESHKLKELQSRKAKIEVSIPLLQKEAQEKQREFSKAQTKLNEINQEIKKLKSSEPVVSEHALLRYLERKYNLDLEDIKREILTNDNVIMIKNMGNGKYPISDGLKAVVKNNTVITIHE